MDKKFIESVIIKLFHEIPQEDSTLTLEQIQNIVKDIDVRTALNKIARNVAGRDYFIKSIDETVNSKNIDNVINIFSKVKFNRIFNEILEARLYGYSCFEIVYDENFLVDSLISIPRKNIKYNLREKKWQLEIGTNKIDLNHEKFLLCIHRYKPSKVTGESILDSCLTTFLNKELFENQLRGVAKKYGDVVTIFGFDPSEDEATTKKRADSLKESEGKTAIGVPVEGLGVVDGADLSKAVHFIKLSDLDPEVYTKLIKNEKLKLIQNILGSTLTVDVGDVGSQALGTVHMEAEEQVAEECCSFISDCLQNLLNAVLPLHRYDPKDFYFSLEKKEDKSKELEITLKTEQVQSQKIDNIAKLITAGYTLSKAYVAKQLGIDIVEINELPQLEFASKKKDLNSLLIKKRSHRDKILEQGEKSFLKDFSKNIKTQIINWALNQTKDSIKPLDFNFNSFYDHALIVKLMAYINKFDDILEFNEELNIFELKFEEAIKYAIEKKPELFDNIDIMQEKVRANAFWVKRSTDITVTEKLMKDLQKNLDNGGTYKEWLKDISNVADRCGMGDNGWYSANVYRTNMLSFYSAGTYEQQLDNIEEQPYWLYDGISDNRQSDVCKELDGKVYVANDSIWGKIYPPNHYQCRSGVIALSKEDLESYSLVVNNPAKKVKQIELGTFQGNPADSYWRTLNKTIEEKEIKLLENLNLFNRHMWAKLNNINDKELRAVVSYVGGSYGDLNTALRNELPLTDFQKEHVSELDKALKKLPFYKGEVTRSIHIFQNEFDDFKKKYVKDKIKTELSYISGTIGDIYNEDSNVQITFISKTARDAQYFNMAEMEVIFERNTKFRVVGVYETKTKLYLRMEEL